MASLSTRIGTNGTTKTYQRDRGGRYRRLRSSEEAHRRADCGTTCSRNGSGRRAVIWSTPEEDETKDKRRWPCGNRRGATKEMGREEGRTSFHTRTQKEA